MDRCDGSGDDIQLHQAGEGHGGVEPGGLSGFLLSVVCAGVGVVGSAGAIRTVTEQRARVDGAGGDFSADVAAAVQARGFDGGGLRLATEGALIRRAVQHGHVFENCGADRFECAGLQARVQVQFLSVKLRSAYGALCHRSVEVNGGYARLRDSPECV